MRRRHFLGILHRGLGLLALSALLGCAPRLAPHKDAVLADQQAQAQALTDMKAQVRKDLGELATGTCGVGQVRAYERGVRVSLPLLKALDKTQGSTLEAALDDGRGGTR